MTKQTEFEQKSQHYYSDKSKVFLLEYFAGFLQQKTSLYILETKRLLDNWQADKEQKLSNCFDVILKPIAQFYWLQHLFREDNN